MLPAQPHRPSLTTACGVLDTKGPILTNGLWLGLELEREALAGVDVVVRG